MIYATARHCLRQILIWQKSHLKWWEMDPFALEFLDPMALEFLLKIVPKRPKCLFGHFKIFQRMAHCFRIFSPRAIEIIKIIKHVFLWLVQVCWDISLAVRSNPLHFCMLGLYQQTKDCKLESKDSSFVCPSVSSYALRGFSPKEDKVELCGRCAQSKEQRPTRCRGFLCWKVKFRSQVPIQSSKDGSDVCRCWCLYSEAPHKFSLLKMTWDGISLAVMSWKMYPYRLAANEGACGHNDVFHPPYFPSI